MTFTSLIFLLFFSVFFAGYWGVRNRTAQNVLIIVGSYFFYGWWDWRFCGLMLLASLIDYWVGIGLDRVNSEPRRKWLLAGGLTANIGMLAYFKYFNFFADSFHRMAQSVGWNVDSVTLNVVLPVGISFYTFQTMSYSIDVYRRKFRATTHIIEYLAYVSFFPQLVAGPIERATNFLPQFFRTRVFNHDQAVDGCRQMLWGFFKKMVIADNLAPLVDPVFQNPAAHSGGALAIATIFFAIQIYCDFSGYSDIAIGLGRLFGFELMRNFAHPYFSQSVGEFWRRWHISLTTWFKDYVYIPLGGSHVSRPRLVFNVLITFLLSGFWHGASWNFLAWGAWNGLLVLPGMFVGRQKSLRVNDMPGGSGVIPSWQAFARIAITFGLICLGWIFFRAETLRDAVFIITRIVSEAFRFEGYFVGLQAVEDAPLGNYLLLAIAILFSAEWLHRREPHALTLRAWPQPLRWATYLGLSATILLAGTFSSTQFVYFQF